MGSGLTAVACLETGRHFIGFEINEDYYNTALSRINEVKSFILKIARILPSSISEMEQKKSCVERF